MDRKPIDYLKEDIASLIFKVDKIQLDLKELKKLSADTKRLIEIAMNEDYVPIPPKKSGWFYWIKKNLISILKKYYI